MTHSSQSTGVLMSSNDATNLTLGHAASWLSSDCASGVRSPAQRQARVPAAYFILARHTHAAFSQIGGVCCNSYSNKSAGRWVKCS